MLGHAHFGKVTIFLIVGTYRYIFGTYLVRGGYVDGTWLVRGFDPKLDNKGPMRIILKMRAVSHGDQRSYFSHGVLCAQPQATRLALWSQDEFTQGLQHTNCRSLKGTTCVH